MAAVLFRQSTGEDNEFNMGALREMTAWLVNQVNRLHVSMWYQSEEIVAMDRSKRE
jgi:hypothetical protein